MSSPFNREIWNTRERPFSTDNNQEATYAELALLEVLAGLLNTRIAFNNDVANTTPPTSFFGDAFKVRPGGGTTVVLSRGVGLFGDAVNDVTAIGGVVGVNDLSAYRPMVLDLPEVITAPINLSFNGRIDIIEVRYRRDLIDPSSRDIMSPVVPFVFTPNMVNKTLTRSLNGQVGNFTDLPSTSYIGYKTGTPDPSPVAPIVTPGYEKIAEIAISGAPFTTIAAADITDFRRIFAPYGMCQATVTVLCNPAANVYSIAGVSAPPGVEITLASSPQSASFFAHEINIKTGRVPSKIFGSNINAEYSEAVVGRTEMGFNGDGFRGVISGQVLTTAPTFGAVAFVGTFNVTVVLSWIY